MKDARLHGEAPERGGGVGKGSAALPGASDTGLAFLRRHPPELLYRLVRWGLGGLLIYMGLMKVMDPVTFLKSVRQYGILEGPPWLNLVAVGLPWFEILCGVLWVLGVWMRGASAWVLVMLVSFTVLVWRHALGLQAVSGMPFCDIRFDCGCGTGEVQVCGKLGENLVLIVATLWVLLHSFRAGGVRAGGG